MDVIAMPLNLDVQGFARPTFRIVRPLWQWLDRALSLRVLTVVIMSQYNLLIKSDNSCLLKVPRRFRSYRDG